MCPFQAGQRYVRYNDHNWWFGRTRLESPAWSRLKRDARGPEDFNGQFSDGLAAVLDGFVFAGIAVDQGVGKGIPVRRLKTDKRRKPLPSNGKMARWEQSGCVLGLHSAAIPGESPRT